MGRLGGSVGGVTGSVVSSALFCRRRRRHVAKLKETKLPRLVETLETM